jgi:hypothetical protein
MPYEIWWMVEQRVVYQRCYGELTIEELKANNDEFVACLMQGTPLVHTIVDLTEVTKFPLKLNDMAQAFKRSDEAVARLGFTLVVGANPMFNFFGRVLTQLWNKARFRMCTTTQEAVEMLGQVDPGLDMSTVRLSNPKQV